MGPSIPSVIHDENGNVIDSRDPTGEPIQFVFEEITWQQKITWEEAAQKLEVAMYPFKKVSKAPALFLLPGVVQREKENCTEMLESS